MSRKLRRALCLLLLTALVLAGCSSGGDPAPVQETGSGDQPVSTIVPVDTSTEAPPSDVLPDTVDVPLTTPEPESTPEPAAVTPAQTEAPVQPGLTYKTLTDPSFGFVFSYPSDWVNQPGKYTACFYAPESESGFPARVAVTRKTLAHRPKDSTVYKQFQSYAQIIYEQYDPATFEYGEINSEASFMGAQAYEVSYLAYSGDVEVEGYLICCAIERSIYVFHFCSAYDEFESLATVMFRMRDSVGLTGT